MANSKIILGNEVLMDLTQDTVDKNVLLQGYTAHSADGSLITGECDFDVNSSSVTARPAEVLENQTFAAAGQVKTGTMPNIGSAKGTLNSISESYTIALGFHDGSGTVSIDPDESAKIIPENIKKGTTILGIEGNYGGEEFDIQSKTATPKLTSQIVIPDEGYDALSQVTIEAIPVTRTPNPAGGITVAIAPIGG